MEINRTINGEVSDSTAPYSVKKMVVHKEGTTLICVTVVHHIRMSQCTHLPFLHLEQASENQHIQDVAPSTNWLASVEVMLIQAQTRPTCVKNHNLSAGQ